MAATRHVIQYVTLAVVMDGDTVSIEPIVGEGGMAVAAIRRAIAATQKCRPAAALQPILRERLYPRRRKSR